MAEFFTALRMEMNYKAKTFHTKKIPLTMMNFSPKISKNA